MTATVVVRPAGSAVPPTQVQAQALADVAARYAKAKVIHASVKPPANTVYMGVGGKLTTLAYYPRTIKVKAGTTLTFVTKSSSEVHNIVFGPSVGEVLVEQVSPAGPTRRLAPAADGTFTVGARRRADRLPRACRHRVVSPDPRDGRTDVSARVVGDRLVGRVDPPRPGATALLQAYDRERFDWRTLARTTVRGARAAVPLGRAQGHLRILVRGGRGWADGASRAVEVG
jgi:plastocyanin